MKRLYSSLLFILLLLQIGCKETSAPVDELIIAPSAMVTLAVNNFRITVMREGELIYGFRGKDSLSISVISQAGLWIAMRQEGVVRGNIIHQMRSGTQSNYRVNSGNQEAGVFLVEASDASRISNWPVSFGAPVTATGSPRIYGDAMCWSSLTSNSDLAGDLLMGNPIQGLRVTQAVYAFKNSGLEDVIFVRYEITNMTSTAWNDVYFGFYSDTDLKYSRYNKTGYDSLRSLSYTYVDTTINNDNHRYATGFTCLELPKQAETRSHRVLTKQNTGETDFQEETFTETNQILYALQGLSNSGLPMVNPVTGTQTLFAFTGDPIAETGWRDVTRDVRSLMSSDPVSINGGETVTVTLTWVVSDGSDLSEALSKLRSKVDEVRSDVSLWQF